MKKNIKTVFKNIHFFVTLCMLVFMGCGSGTSIYYDYYEKGNTGIASWYGPKFHGKRTASGEIFNMYDYTAAHRYLPFNTKVRVKNLLNNKTVIVRINDRGPFVKNRIIDLSYAAAKKIGMLKTGTAPVKIEVISREIYYVQVGCFSSIESSNQILYKLKKKKFKPFKVNRRGLWCIRVGPFYSLKTAKQRLNRIKRFYINSFIVAD